MSFTERLDTLRKNIRAAALRAGRDPSSIRILPVTKTVEPERIREAYDAGLRCFGENRVQEMMEKIERLPPDVEWHMIGRLQTNKVKYLIGRVSLIQSLDRPELAREIERLALKRGVAEVPCLIEINSTGEAQKGGLAPEEAVPFLKTIPDGSPIRIHGLMTVGPLEGGEEDIRRCFSAVNELQARLKEDFPRHSWDILSMGMSGDYEIAVEEGANLIRVGSLLFGSRKT